MVVCGLASGMAASLVAQYDDLIRCTNVITGGGCEPEFIKFVLNQEECRKRWLASEQECKRLRLELEKLNAVKENLEMNLSMARRIVDMEKKKRRQAEEERDSLEKQIGLVREVVFIENRINDETKERLAFLNNTASRSRVSIGRQDGNILEAQRLSAIKEDCDTTGSLLSDLSYSRSEDDLDVDVVRTIRSWRKHRPSITVDEVEDHVPKRRRKSNRAIEIDGVEAGPDEHLVATTTFKMARDGPISATSRIEAVPSSETKSSLSTPVVPPLKNVIASAPPKPTDLSSDTDDSMTPKTSRKQSIQPSPHVGGFNFGADKIINNRPHAFCSKTIIRPEMCEPCSKKIKFGKIALKCRDCRGVCHLTCKDNLPLPCVPVTNTPTGKGFIGSIADFAPPTPPMIPALILHCVKEVEARGLNEVGLYRVPGSDRDVRMLREKFLRARGVPNLSGVEIPVICGTIKDFLRSLKEPLVTYSLWPEFIRTVDIKDLTERNSALYQLISELPQPNRDTLAFMILHLQKVSECPECKMPASNLAKVFGPTLIGFSSQEPEPMAVMTESKQLVPVVENLMSLPSEYWAHFVNNNSTPISSRSDTLFATPSATSLKWQHSGSSTRRFFNTPHGGNRPFGGKKFFTDSPMQKE
ncbi:rac GTPase-activating protein 1 [Schistocerca cancellata]|uniref:rac GTPase-activating protein 1 n=1 Tax=Schistocerca cancellata TaxID=274614 RepID=UPI00211974AD|nr:rac GTPase-activating protein 1 [Schistocerca cancellata]